MAQHKPLRVGIIGCGGIARYQHVPSYLRCSNVRLVAACDVDEQACRQLAEQHGVETSYTDYRELLALPALDLVSICTTNDMHHPIALAAIERGLDVYCEKPLALNLEQARQMYTAAEARGTRTGVNFSHRRTPAAQLAREIIASGALGEIHYVSAVYAAGWPDYAERPGSWRNDRRRAGYGGLGDMGSHVLDMMMWWLDCGVTAVTAQTATYVPERALPGSAKRMRVTTEDQGMLLMRYENGAMGYLCGSYMFTGRGYDQRAEIYGRNGGLIYDQQRPLELKVHLPEDALRRYQVLREGGRRDTPYTTILVPERLHGLLPEQPSTVRRAVIMDYIDALRADGPFTFSPGFREGLRAQEVLEACTLSEERRGWVELPLP